MESGTNTVKQTRRDAASVVISRSFTINIPRRPFHAPLLLKYCDSWIKLSKHSTVIDLSRASTYRLSNTIVTLCHPGRHRTCSRSHQYSITSTYVCRVSQDTRDPYKIQTDVFSREKVLLTRVQSIFNTLLKIASISGSIRG